jgi:hypothetical protein
MAYSITHTPDFWEERFGTPDCARNYHYYAYEYLDDLNFMPPAHEVFGEWSHAARLLEAVGAKLKTLGWEGDGEFQLLWVPPFAGAGEHDFFGAYALHVKQENDGISWIACPVPLPFHRLFQRDTSTYPKPDPADHLGEMVEQSRAKGAVRWLGASEQ